MFPTYIDPIAAGLPSAFATTMHPGLLGIEVAALCGLITITLLVALDTARSRRRWPRRGAPVSRPEVRRAA